MDFIELLKEWFKLKIALWNKKGNIVFKQGDLWWCSLGINLGEEIFGKGEKFTRWVMLNQARILDKKRLTNKIGTIDDADFERVRQRFIGFFGSLK